MIIPLFFSCKGQEAQEKSIREAVYAGSFYPAEKSELEMQLKNYFASAAPRKNNVRAVIAPHAGYVFSGSVAADAYNQILPDKAVKNVFILAPAHRVYITSASVFCGDAYETPLGNVPVNRDIADKLLKSEDVFKFNAQAHAEEHSIEVQLPFLQYHLETDFKIVPVLINTDDVQKLENIAALLKPYYTDENLFVVSTDFSHYPGYEDAIEVDSLTAKAALTGEPEKLMAQIRENSKAGIENLHTSMCGLSPMQVMLHLVESAGHSVEKISYRNSADSPYGEKDRVVGYWAMCVREGQNSAENASDEAEFSLNDTEKRELLEIARATLEAKLQNEELPDIESFDLSSNLRTQTGCFVTLHKNGELRGCIGRFMAQQELAKTVQEMAVSAALHDHRFSKLTYDELDEIDIEISALTPLKAIESLDEFELGKHGIYIRDGFRTGTYLPQVAEGRNWSKEEFVSHCARYKAGISGDGWKDAELFTYEALVFSEKEQHDE